MGAELEIIMQPLQDPLLHTLHLISSAGQENRGRRRMGGRGDEEECRAKICTANASVVFANKIPLHGCLDIAPKCDVCVHAENSLNLFA